MKQHLYNIEGILHFNNQRGEFSLRSGRSLNLEGRLFNRFPLEAISLSQQLSGKSAIHHGLAAVLALEDYLQLKPTQTAAILRRVVSELATLHAHLSYFYLELLPDYLSPSYLKRNPQWGFYFTPPSYNSRGDRFLSLDETRDFMAHYPLVRETLSHLEKAICSFTGKFPAGLWLIPGGITAPPLERDRIMAVLRHLEQCKDLIERAWPEDVKQLIKAFPELGQVFSKTLGLLSFGSFPPLLDNVISYSAGVYQGHRLEPVNELKITESLQGTFYKDSFYGADSSKIVYDLAKRDAQTWIKSARYETEPLLCGALARMLVTHFGGGNAEISDLVQTLDKSFHFEELGSNSAAARLISLFLEARAFLKNSFQSLLDLDYSLPLNQGGNFDFSKRGIGLGKCEAPAGSLLHQVYIDKGKVLNYRVVTAQNWNLAGKDEFGKFGPALQEIHQQDLPRTSPLQLSRILHSYYAQGLDASQ